MWSHKKGIASLFALVSLAQIFSPVAAYALTSGPAQPESKGFQVAGVEGLVDPFTGDFSYNLSLLHVGGYPINLSYHSGAGMDDEAGWVGFGWSLSPGYIDRQMRGLPDEFNGESDKIKKEFNLRNDITAGIDFSVNPEVLGVNISKLVNVGVGAGIQYNNKRGLAVQFGLQANAPMLSNGKASAGTNTAALAGSASLSFNSQYGVSFNPALSFSIVAKHAADCEKNMSGLSLGASINSRAGLQYTTLGQSFNTSRLDAATQQEIRHSFGSSAVSYAAQTYLPETQANFFNQSYSLSPQFGPEAWGLFAGIQLTGHYSMQKVANRFAEYNAYGYLHSAAAKNDDNALMDFNREKDVPWFDNVPALPVPVATPDIFTVHAQDGTTQYRAYTGGSGIFSDHTSGNTSVNASAGIELGAGAGFKLGGDLQGSLSKTVTGKWKSGNHLLFEDDNAYDAYGNFTGSGEVNDPLYEPVYFRRVGELVPDINNFESQVQGENAVRVKTNGNLAGAVAEPMLMSRSENTALDKRIVRKSRAGRNNVFSFLTAAEAGESGLDKNIVDYYRSAGGFHPLLRNCSTAISTVEQPFKKDHHPGEITITDDKGGRKVYGIPAYNTYREDVSFSTGENSNQEDLAKGLIAYSKEDASVNNKKGFDHFYSKEIVPGYAHAYLLTAVLSPDYIDRTGDGISDDDAGTAIKFNYWRKTDAYQWRTPYAAGKANFSEGLISDKTDNRASYSYGQKELWYLHSIESPTTVAVFETGDREDALGANSKGEKDLSEGTRQQYLKTIRLYAKADWQQHSDAAIPLQTVHFVYDYSLFADSASGVPNNSGLASTDTTHIIRNQGGKLTLKKLFFTYGNNTRGQLQPWEFTYASNAPYQWKQYDRWGNYKEEQENPAGIRNDWYPYSDQDKTRADQAAALWQLTKVTTPPGGKINVEYESDDYAYVQNRRAMQMYPLAGVGENLGENAGFAKGNKLFVRLSEHLASDGELLRKYFRQSSPGEPMNIFLKALVELTKNKFEYISCYAEVENITHDVRLVPGHDDVAEITVKRVKGEGVTNEYHPLAKAAWQFMRINTPSLVYPGYNVREDLAPVQFVKALIGAIASVAELLAPFDTRAELHRFAASVDLTKSWVRLDAGTNDTKFADAKQYCAKLGGGSRVKEIDITDDWQRMSNSSAPDATYGLVYDYTRTETDHGGNQEKISSGVASYEPMIGNEENPFHQPVTYRQQVKLGPDNAYFIDEPFCESWFPAPSVGYSMVTVRNKGADGSIGETGITISEFYTSKDFPTEVSRTPIDVRKFGGAGILQALKIKANNSRVVSQGFSVVLNDMHGKPKSEKTFGKGLNEISSVEYHYKVSNDHAPEKTLDNNITVLQPDGSATLSQAGHDVEMYTDMRSQTSFTAGLNVMMNLDAIYLLFAVVPVPVVLPLPNASYNGFRSASTVKVIQQYGILDKIVKTTNGSRIETQNLAWDAVSGEALLTMTQNEFDDPVFQFHYPAHWIIPEGMGAAAVNNAAVLNPFSAEGGIIKNYANLLVGGDELVIETDSTAVHCWVNQTDAHQLVLIDRMGSPVSVNGTAHVLRSGRRNVLSASAGTLTSLVNPLHDGRIEISQMTRVLDADAVSWAEEWPIALPNILQSAEKCPDGYSKDLQGRCFREIDSVAEPSYTIDTRVARQKDPRYAGCGTYITNLSSAWLTGTANDPPGNAKTTLSTNGIWKNGTTNCGNGTTGDEDGPLNRSGIWIAGRNASNYYNQWVGIKSKFYLASSDAANKSADGKTGFFFLGFGSQHSIEIRIDNVLVAAHNRNSDNLSTSPMRTWRIKPISLALDRQHEIFIRVKNEVSGGAAVMGAEIYNNTFNELNTATCVNPVCLPCTFCSTCRTAGSLSQCSGQPMANSIWSTRCLSGRRFNYHASTGGVPITDFDPVCQGALFEDANCLPICRWRIRSYAPPVAYTICDLPMKVTINPYTTGLRGIWRQRQSFRYYTERTLTLPFIKPGDKDVPGKTDIRTSGTYTQFTPFWSFTANGWKPAGTGLDPNWKLASENTGWNDRGEETENRDILNRYSAAAFGYQRTAVTAVANNANASELLYDGFEDYEMSDRSCPVDSCTVSTWPGWQNAIRKNPTALKVSLLHAHTGRASLMVSPSADATVNMNVGLPASGPMYSFSGAAMQIEKPGLTAGFLLKPSSRYMVSAWIKDEGGNVQTGPAQDPSKAAIDVLITGQVFSTVKAGPAVDGWRKVETVFLLPATATTCTIRLRSGTGTAYFDDVRIHSFDAVVKTYAYDTHSMRLWAELDENNFASFYEYDDEGRLTRVKKETEKGILTLRESHAAFKSSGK